MKYSQGGHTITSPSLGPPLVTVLLQFFSPSRRVVNRLNFIEGHLKIELDENKRLKVNKSILFSHGYSKYVPDIYSIHFFCREWLVRQLIIPVYTIVFRPVIIRHDERHPITANWICSAKRYSINMENSNGVECNVKVTNAFKSYGNNAVIDGLNMNVSSGSMWVKKIVKKKTPQLGVLGVRTQHLYIYMTKVNAM